MSYLTLRDRVKNIIDRHGSQYTEAEKCVIKALFKWLEGERVDSSLLDVFYQLAEFKPGNISDEDRQAVVKLILSACSL